MTVKPGVKLKQVCGQSFLIPMGEDNIDLSKIVALNESSLVMWQRMSQGPFTIDDLVDALLEEYDATAEQVRPDAEAVIKQFKEEKIITE